MDIQTDILIIGSGIAGCAAALAAARGGADVTMITGATDPLESNTAHAQGGIVTLGEGDSPELLERDIMEAGAGLCLPDAVRYLAEEAPALVQRLLVDELGVEFSRGESGQLDMTEEAAHSLPRILHADDLTGRAIALKMLDAVRANPRITLLTGHMAVDLLNLPDRSANLLDQYRPPCCVGAYVLDTASGQVATVRAQETILATGGLGRIYLHTTNPWVARGDGVAMAYRIGARLQNLEYVQFHPTTLYHRDADNYLITESMRGEGGRLVNSEGAEFMERYHPLGSLAPRDIVARGIQDEMLRSGRSCVYLDITHKNADWVRGRFPNIYRTCLKYHIDITSQPIPVVPAAHYSCGGVLADRLGRTTIPRLRAAGEVSCTGLHGANRLASTSLLEGLLWGWSAGEDCARWLGKRDYRMAIPPIRPFIAETEPSDPALIAQDWLSIKYTMWNYVGLARTAKRMARALSILRELQQEVQAFYQKAQPTESIIGLRNGVTAALAVLFAAQRNHTSRGCHFVQEN
jgi:L-aspartate oxidase